MSSEHDLQRNSGHNGLFQVGQDVEAQWSDGHFYKAKITRLVPGDKYAVLFTEYNETSVVPVSGLRTELVIHSPLVSPSPLSSPSSASLKLEQLPGQLQQDQEHAHDVAAQSSPTSEDISQDDLEARLARLLAPTPTAVDVASSGRPEKVQLSPSPKKTSSQQVEASPSLNFDVLSPSSSSNVVSPSNSLRPSSSPLLPSSPSSAVSSPSKVIIRATGLGSEGFEAKEVNSTLAQAAAAQQKAMEVNNTAPVGKKMAARVGAVAKGQTTIAYSYDVAFEYLKIAKEHEKLKSVTATFYYIEAAAHFLKASQMEESERSKKLVAEKVAGFVCRMALMIRVDGFRPLPVPSPEVPAGSVQFQLAEAASYYSLGVSCEEAVSSLVDQQDQLQTIAGHFYKQAVFSYLDALKNFQQLENEELKRELGPSVLQIKDRINATLNRTTMLKAKIKESELAIAAGIKKRSNLFALPSVDGYVDAEGVEGMYDQMQTPQGQWGGEGGLGPAAQPAVISPSQARMAERRMKILQELVATEQSYCDSLTVLISTYLNPLRLKAESADAILSPQQVKKVFSNLDILQQLHASFLVDLRARVHETSPETLQKPWVVGDLFLQFGPYLKLYSEYVTNHEGASAELTLLLQSASFAKFCASASAQSVTKGMALSSFLIMPVQRIPRYKMLLADLLQNTWEEHPDFENINQALQLIGNVASHINEEIRAMENRRAIADLEQQFVSPPNFLAPGRLLIKQGPLMKKARNADYQYEFFLFNDMLAYAAKNPITKKYKLHRKIDINDGFSVSLQSHMENRQGEEVPGFGINSPQKSFLVYAANDQERQEWLAALQNCVEDYEMRRKLLVMNISQTQADIIRGLPSTHSLLNERDWVKPIWQQNNQAEHCAVCAQNFSIFNWRHHCRECGRIVCAACSKGRRNVVTSATVKKVSDEVKVAQRVCVECLEDTLLVAGKSSMGTSTRQINHAELMPVQKQVRSLPVKGGGTIEVGHTKDRNVYKQDKDCIVS